jgi:hypothetical protein
VGTNHTKHKNKYPTSTTTATNSSNNNNNSNNNGTLSAAATQPTSAYPTLQYSTAVHYPSNAGITITNSTSNFGYEEGY